MSVPPASTAIQRGNALEPMTLPRILSIRDWNRAVANVLLEVMAGGPRSGAARWSAAWRTAGLQRKWQGSSSRAASAASRATLAAFQRRGIPKSGFL